MILVICRSFIFNSVVFLNVLNFQTSSIQMSYYLLFTFHLFLIHATHHFIYSQCDVFNFAKCYQFGLIKTLFQIIFSFIAALVTKLNGAWLDALSVCEMKLLILIVQVFYRFPFYLQNVKLVKFLRICMQ